MPEASFYRAYLSPEAADFVYRSPRRKQRLLLSQISRLERFPFLPADYHTLDEEGFEVLHYKSSGTIISYAVDHAAKRVIILDLASVE